MKPEGQESRNPEDSAPSVIEDPEVAPVSPVVSATAPQKSYKSLIFGCLGVLLLIGVIGVSTGWWYHSQRYVLAESDAHTEMIFRVIPNEDSDKRTEALVADEAKQKIIEAFKNRLVDYGVANSVTSREGNLISIKLPSKDSEFSEEFTTELKVTNIKIIKNLKKLALPTFVFFINLVIVFVWMIRVFSTCLV